MKVLITGSEGSLMQAVIPQLLMLGYDIVGVDNFFKKDRIDTKERNYTFICGDLVNNDFVEGLFEKTKPDYVIQAAARIYGVAGFHKDGANILGNDFTLHSNILRASVSHKVARVVYISSSMVYETIEKKSLTETDTELMSVPKTEYGLSKYVCERLSQVYYKDYDLPYTIWRPFNIITPYEIAFKDIGISHVFADFIENIVVEKRNPLPIIGDGKQIRCFTWIHDVADVAANFSFEDTTKNEIFNVGIKEPVTMRELANEIYNINNSILGRYDKGLMFRENVKSFKDDVKVRIPNVDKINKVLGWEAKVKLNDSIENCIREVYRRVKW
ncbi:MAG: NAD-dependent epimerase/dehydratase family protein [Candidatus Paceibacterota bacterium]